MSERFSDVIFLISPFIDARFKGLWLNNLHIDVKTRVLEKIRNAFVSFFTKLTYQLPKMCQLVHQMHRILLVLII